MKQPPKPTPKAPVKPAAPKPALPKVDRAAREQQQAAALYRAVRRALKD